MWALSSFSPTLLRFSRHLKRRLAEVELEKEEYVNLVPSINYTSYPDHFFLDGAIFSELMGSYPDFFLFLHFFLLFFFLRRLKILEIPMTDALYHLLTTHLSFILYCKLPHSLDISCIPIIIIASNYILWYIQIIHIGSSTLLDVNIR